MPKFNQVTTKDDDTRPKLGPPDIRLGISIVHNAIRVALSLSPKEQDNNRMEYTEPAILVSYVYLKEFSDNRQHYHFRDWTMDSGAFSANSLGIKIDLQAYIDCCRELIASDEKLTEVYALDVIGDWKASLKNTEEMWRQGIPAIPCFHIGEPWDALIGIAKDYPKIALGGVARANIKTKIAWTEQCFARVWPKPIHGFGYGTEASILKFPFHSVDASNWELIPCKYGRWRSFDNQRISVRGTKQNLRKEIEWYLELERKARYKWRKEMLLLEKMFPNAGRVRPGDSVPPNLYLTVSGTHTARREM